MFKILYNSIFTVLCLFCINSRLQGEIIETNEITDVLNYVNQESVVFFNITDTLYEPANTMADKAWRTYFAETVRKTISDKKTAERLINETENEIVNKIPKRAVEEVTPQLIRDLQNQEIPVLGLTRKNMSTPYADNFGEITSNHIKSIGIDLEKTLNYMTFEKNNEGRYSFFYGILFTHKQPEGPAVLSLLKGVNSQPTRVVVVDNNRSSLEGIEKALEGSGIEFKGVRYGRTDARKASFDLDLGTIEAFKFRDKIIYDDEALLIKQQYPKFNWSRLLEKFLEALKKLS